MSISALAIRRPVTTAMFFLGASLLGLVSFQRLTVELVPELVYPEIFVAAGTRAASPEQVEQDLVLPIEGEIGKLAGVVSIESEAAQNRATVRISFEPDADMKFAELQVQRQMSRLQPNLPEGSTVNVQRIDTSALTTAVMQLQVLGEGDLNWLRDFTEERIRPELEAVEGVVSATPLGGQQRAVEVIVDPELLAAHGLSMDAITGALDQVNTPRAYLGSVYEGDRAYAVSIQGQASGLQQIRQVVLRPEGPLTLSDVADVHYGLQERTDISRINGRAAVSIRVQKENEANLIEVASGLEAAVEQLNRDLAPQGVELLVTNNQADMMNEALDTLKWAAVVGVILGLVVLFLFLRNVRFVSILMLAIPVSLLVTFNLMYTWDLSLNVLSVCGLALAMGMLADNGIVVMEAIFKHFEAGKPAAEAARDGTAEVSRAVIAATATTILVFLPVVFIQSDFQDILQELALAIIFPLAVSLLVALTLVPMLGARTLSQMSMQPLGTGRLLEMYTVALKGALRHRARVAVAVGGALAITLVVSFFFMLQSEALPQESQFNVYVDMGQGGTLDATDAVVRQVEEAVGELDHVDRFTTNVQETQGSVTVMLVDLADNPERPSVEELQDILDEQLEDIEGGYVGFDPPAGLGGGGGGGGGGDGFSLDPTAAQVDTATIRGPDFLTLQMIADDLSFRLEGVEDVEPRSIRADLARSGPEVQVIPDAMAMFDRGVDVSTVLGAIQQADPQGVQASAGFLEPDGTETPIELRYVDDPEEDRIGIDDLRQLPVLTPSGRLTPIEEVARVRTDEGRNTILRSDRSRRVTVSWDFTDEVKESQPLLDAAREQVQMVARNMVLPEAYSMEIEEAEVDTVYYWMMGVAALLVYMVLASLFESVSAPIVVLGTLPTAVIGSCWALILSGTGLTSQAGPMALLGFIVLIGIAVNNGIILIDFISTLRNRHGFRRERAVLAASRSRVRPILMTSATTLLGVLPLALEFGGDYEIWPPFAITVLGGLSVSMVSTLIFVPVAYMGIDQVKEWLRDIGMVGVGAATAAAAAASYGIWSRYDSIFWTSMLAPAFWFAALGVVWAGILANRARLAAKKEVGPVGSIRLHTLTKIYGAPGPLRRDWGRFERRARSLTSAGRDPFDRAGIRDGLLWKVPLLALLVFLHTYMTNPPWVFLLALSTWGLLAHLARQVALLLPWREPGEELSPRLRAAMRWGLLAVFLAYIQLRMGFLSLTIASAAAFMLVRLVRLLARRVEAGVVNPERMEGRLAWLRRRAYKTAAAVPFIGVPRRQFEALGGVDLEIGRGMFGLLGPNGAGKTTMMRIVCRLLQPTYGSVSIDGTRLEEVEQLQGLIGYLPQHFGLYEHMTGREYLRYRALLEGFRDPEQREARVLECLEQVNLADRMDDPIGSYSGGMKQRVGIAQTLLHTPRIVVVDEPTAGLDPVERIRFRNLLARLSRDRIVIFSTHIVEDVAGSCNRLAVLNQGSLLYAGSPAEMRDLAEDRVWEAVVSEEEFDRLEERHRVITHLRVPGGIRARFLAVEPPAQLEARRVEANLEDAYLHLLDRHRRAA